MQYPVQQNPLQFQQMQCLAVAQPPIQCGMIATQLTPAQIAANMQPAQTNIGYPAVIPNQMNNYALPAQAGTVLLPNAGTNLQAVQWPPHSMYFHMQ